jgi:ComF family protein
MNVLIHALKYHHHLAIADFFAARMAKQIRRLNIDYLVPVPLHPQRLCERGFNQAALIAQGINRRLGIPIVYRALLRDQATHTQTGLNWQARAKNLQGAFSCNAHLECQRIMLIDDVMTSGATAQACAEVLKQHAVHEVHLAVAARVVLP